MFSQMKVKKKKNQFQSGNLEPKPNQEDTWFNILHFQGSGWGQKHGISVCI